LKNYPVTDERVIILNNLRIKRKEIESHPNVKGLISCRKNLIYNKAIRRF